MSNYTAEIEEILGFVERKEEMVAMIAPSFLVDFSYPEFVGMLRRLGFGHVVEVGVGAVETNRQLLDLLKLSPGQRYITAPCPTIVRLVKNKYPDLVPFLALVDSPMIATAKIVAEKYPNHRKVYIGPCVAKKLEAKEDHAELEIVVLTYQEIAEIFRIKNIFPQKSDQDYSFDLAASHTRLYPISGGLAQSSGLTKTLTDSEYSVISGPELVEKTLQEFSSQPEIKLLDILYCEGGCISGAGIINQESLDSRREKIITFWHNEQK